jgi:hypothetical protein
MIYKEYAKSHVYVNQFWFKKCPLETFNDFRLSGQYENAPKIKFSMVHYFGNTGLKCVKLKGGRSERFMFHY